MTRRIWSQLTIFRNDPHLGMSGRTAASFFASEARR